LRGGWWVSREKWVGGRIHRLIWDRKGKKIKKFQIRLEPTFYLFVAILTLVYYSIHMYIMLYIEM